MNEDAVSHRRNLREYTLPLLDQLHHDRRDLHADLLQPLHLPGRERQPRLMLTIPLVVFGLFRYLYLIYVKSAGDRPDELLWRDRQIFVTIALWFGLALALLYLTPSL